MEPFLGFWRWLGMSRDASCGERSARTSGRDSRCSRACLEDGEGAGECRRGPGARAAVAAAGSVPAPAPGAAAILGPALVSLVSLASPACPSASLSLPSLVGPAVPEPPATCGSTGMGRGTGGNFTARRACRCIQANFGGEDSEAPDVSGAPGAPDASKSPCDLTTDPSGPRDPGLRYAPIGIRGGDAFRSCVFASLSNSPREPCSPRGPHSRSTSGGSDSCEAPDASWRPEEPSIESHPRSGLSNPPASPTTAPICSRTERSSL